MNLIVLGPPGSGKSTQSKLLSEFLSVTHIVSGDIAREIATADNPLGSKVKKDIKDGQLIPTELLFPKISGAILEAVKKGGFVLDGYPRDQKEAQRLSSFLQEKNIEIKSVIVIVVSAANILARLAKRAAVEMRSDDTPSAINERLAIYNNQTQEVISSFRGQGLVREVNGDGTIANVWTQVISLITP